jgi:hypothetical protein
VNGATLGRNVARWVARRHFQPIDDDSGDRDRRHRRDDDAERRK